MDPRTRDAIRQIPIELEKLKKRVSSLEKIMKDVHKFTRSTNESVVRKYGGGKKNTVVKVVEKITKNK